MKAGFVPALGTPLDQDGNLVVESYKKQIEDQIQAGAVGILAMGSMGQQAYLRQDVCPKVAEVAVEAANGRVPVFVGAMDCSIIKKYFLNTSENILRKTVVAAGQGKWSNCSTRHLVQIIQ